MLEFLNSPSLYLAQNEIVLHNTFDKKDDISPWNLIDGEEFHWVNVETNVDGLEDLEGQFLVDAMGSYHGGTVETEIELETFGEIIFEYYFQNFTDVADNYFKFYIDDEVKLEGNQTTPWQRIRPIGIRPGKHSLKFEYNPGASLNEKKFAVDNIIIYQSKKINCIIRDYKPPKPSLNLVENKILRGFTRKQEMTKADTTIKFQAIFYSEYYEDFVRVFKRPFYFVTEYGTCYRGTFAGYDIENIGLCSAYSFDLELICDQEIGIGFC